MLQSINGRDTFVLSLLKIKAVRVGALLLLGAFAHALPAAAQVTSLSMQSDPGDYIGLGQTYLYTPAGGVFDAQVSGNNSVISISFRSTPNVDHFWNLLFMAPNGAPLTPGTYPNALRSAEARRLDWMSSATAAVAIW